MIFLKNILLIIFFTFFINLNLYSLEIKIIKKVGEEIITNIDIQKEYQYLLALSESYENTDEKLKLNLAKESIIKEKIKKNEIIKFFNLDVSNQDLINDIIKNLYLSIGINNKSEFEKYLQKYDLIYQEIYDKIQIEVVWNQLIYEKYENQLNINEQLIKEKLKNIKKERTSYNLSEIVFTASTKSELLLKHEKIKNSINELSFEKTVTLYSESDSKKESGLIGWVYEDQLSQKFRKELKNLGIGQLTNLLSISGGALILKVNDIKIETKAIDLKIEIEKNIKFEKQKQLNNFSLIYFNKTKNILLNE